MQVSTAVTDKARELIRKARKESEGTPAEIVFHAVDGVPARRAAPFPSYRPRLATENDQQSFPRSPCHAGPHPRYACNRQQLALFGQLDDARRTLSPPRLLASWPLPDVLPPPLQTPVSKSRSWPSKLWPWPRAWLKARRCRPLSKPSTRRLPWLQAILKSSPSAGPPRHALPATLASRRSMQSLSLRPAWLVRPDVTPWAHSQDAYIHVAAALTPFSEALAAATTIGRATIVARRPASPLSSSVSFTLLTTVHLPHWALSTCVAHRAALGCARARAAAAQARLGAACLSTHWSNLSIHWPNPSKHWSNPSTRAGLQPRRRGLGQESIGLCGSPAASGGGGRGAGARDARRQRLSPCAGRERLQRQRLGR